MLCEVIAYILSRQRLSAKTFVTGCVFYALQDRLSLWMLCDTAGVGGFPLHFSTGSPFGHHPRLRMVCPLWGQWVRAGRFLFSLPLHFSTSPRVLPSGITRGYAWCVPRWGQWVRAGRFLFSLPLHFSTSPLLHGFTLRASPAVTHGVSPLGTVDAGLIIKSLYSLRG